MKNAADRIITGEQAGDNFGFALGSGDLDADGGLDLIIGSRTHVLKTRADPHFNDAGKIYVFYGAPNPGAPEPTKTPTGTPTATSQRNVHAYTDTDIHRDTHINFYRHDNGDSNAHGDICINFYRDTDAYCHDNGDTGSRFSASNQGKSVKRKKATGKS